MNNKTKKEKILKSCYNQSGYLFNSLSKNNKYSNYFVHRLVATAFIPNPDEKPQVNHKNGVKSDNSLYNLEWMTSKENINHAKLTGLNNNIGIKHGRSKLSEENVLEIREKYKTGSYTYTQLGTEYKIDRTVIGDIINKNLWTHI